MTKPISPDEISKAKIQYFPSFVFEAVNMLLAAKFSNSSATILQKDIKAKIFELAPEDFKSADIYKLGWLNFEEVYESQGWEVTYDKPAYNETYDANFTFKVKK